MPTKIQHKHYLIFWNNFLKDRNHYQKIQTSKPVVVLNFQGLKFLERWQKEIKFISLLIHRWCNSSLTIAELRWDAQVSKQIIFEIQNWTYVLDSWRLCWFKSAIQYVMQYVKYFDWIFFFPFIFILRNKKQIPPNEIPTSANIMHRIIHHSQLFEFLSSFLAFHMKRAQNLAFSINYFFFIHVLHN